ncbi:hypothetical protein [Beduinella massiliensis]|uniref:hypothetical protein n=1 Tax=Beduinella massiliensis TaxID=1852363 RepID=UPI0031F7DAB8
MQDGIAALPQEQQAGLRELWQKNVEALGIDEGTAATLEAVQEARKAAAEVEAEKTESQNISEETGDLQETTDADGDIMEEDKGENTFADLTAEEEITDQSASENDIEKPNEEQVVIKFLPTSGIPIANNPDKTTTILGRYQTDIKWIIEELNIEKNTDFGEKKGGFNVLNVPDDFYITGEQFWQEYNKPFLDAAIERGDDIVMTTPINNSSMYLISGEITGYGREYQYLCSHGYELVNGKMVKKEEE